MSDPRRARAGGGRPGWWPVPDRRCCPRCSGVPPLAAVGMAAGADRARRVRRPVPDRHAWARSSPSATSSGCLLAVAWVRRDGLFWTAGAAAAAGGGRGAGRGAAGRPPRPGTGIAERALVVGAPLVNAFPTMALTTGLALAAGVFRLVTQRLRTPSSRRAAPAGQLPARARCGRSSRGSENVRLSSAVVTSSTSSQPRSARWSSTPRTSTSGTEAPLVTPTVPTPSSQPSSISPGVVDQVARAGARLPARPRPAAPSSTSSSSRRPAPGRTAAAIAFTATCRFWVA